LSASRRATGAVAEVLSKERIVSLHSSCGRCVATNHRAIDHIKAILSLIQPQLVVSRRTDVGKVNGAPFDIEDPVGRSARHRGEDTAGATRESRATALRIGALVVPIREDQIRAGCVRQAGVREDRDRAHELESAIRVYIRSSIGLVV
jgi:hypothetical protein